MANLNDFVIWRGDLSFIQSPFGEVDGAILAVCAYFNYDIVLCDEELPLPMNYKQVLTDYLSINGRGDLKLGLIFPTQKYIALLKHLVKSERYGNIEVSDFVNEVNIENSYQFSAVTYHLSDGSMAVVFRGTDDSFVGWKEDFCLSFMESIPSQRLAVEYLEFIADKYPSKPIYICGHSKGGNLSVYSAVFATEKVQDRIVNVYSYDGPGLDDSVVESENYKNIAPKLCPFIPQCSTIGVMFNNGSFKVIKSRGSGAHQHDVLTWEVLGSGFIRLPELAQKGLKNQSGFKAMMSRMTQSEKENFVNIFFSAIERTGAHTLMDLNEAKLKNLSIIVKSINGLSKEERELMLDIIKKLLEKQKK